LQSTHLQESLESLKSSLAQSDGELLPGGNPPRVAFEGAKFWSIFGLRAIIFAPDMLANQSSAL